MLRENYNEIRKINSVRENQNFPRKCELVGLLVLHIYSMLLRERPFNLKGGGGYGFFFGKTFLSLTWAEKNFLFALWAFKDIVFVEQK